MAFITFFQSFTSFTHVSNNTNHHSYSFYDWALFHWCIKACYMYLILLYTNQLMDILPGFHFLATINNMLEHSYKSFFVMLTNSREERCLTLWGTNILFPTAAAVHTIPPSDVYKLQFLPILSNTCYCVSVSFLSTPELTTPDWLFIATNIITGVQCLQKESTGPGGQFFLFIFPSCLFTLQERNFKTERKRHRDRYSPALSFMKLLPCRWQPEA